MSVSLFCSWSTFCCWRHCLGIYNKVHKYLDIDAIFVFFFPVYHHNDLKIKQRYCIKLSDIIAIFAIVPPFSEAKVTGNVTDKQFQVRCCLTSGQVWPVPSLFYDKLSRLKVWCWFKALNLRLVAVHLELQMRSREVSMQVKKTIIRLRKKTK